jgi:hypothetical protein
MGQGTSVRIDGELGNMSSAQKAEDHLPPEIIPPIRPTVPWRLASVEVLENYSLRVRFLDGTEGVVHMAGLISATTSGMFRDLRDPQRFAEVYLEFGAVTWPGGIDLAPDAMYDEIKAHGAWVL